METAIQGLGFMVESYSVYYRGYIGIMGKKWKLLFEV